MKELAEEDNKRLRRHLLRSGEGGMSNEYPSPTLITTLCPCWFVDLYLLFYATLEYIRHFIFAGCYDNDPWYLVTNLVGHLDFRGI